MAYRGRQRTKAEGRKDPTASRSAGKVSRFHKQEKTRPGYYPGLVFYSNEFRPSRLNSRDLRTSLVRKHRSNLLTEFRGLLVSVNCDGVDNCQIQHFLFGAGNC